MGAGLQVRQQVVLRGRLRGHASRRAGGGLRHGGADEGPVRTGPAVQGLFEDTYSLVPLSYWLPGQRADGGRYKEVVNLLDAVLKPARYTFTGEMEKGDYLFERGGNRVPFLLMSDGYRAFIGWVADLLYHLSVVTPPGEPLVESRGIVMVDEIDLHLHPRWQMKVIKTVAKALPRLQFIFTSHSPLVAGSLEWRNIITLKLSPKANRTVVKRLKESIHGLDADQVLLTDFFGLKTTRAPGKVTQLEELERKARHGDREAARSSSSDEPGDGGDGMIRHIHPRIPKLPDSPRTRPGSARPGQLQGCRHAPGPRISRACGVRSRTSTSNCSTRTAPSARSRWKGESSRMSNISGPRPGRTLDGARRPRPRFRRGWVRIVQPTDGSPEPGYRSLAYHPLNYAIACKPCNSVIKKNYFPGGEAPQDRGEESPRRMPPRSQRLLPSHRRDRRRSRVDFITFVEGVVPQPARKSGLGRLRALVTISIFRPGDPIERKVFFQSRSRAICDLYMNLQFIRENRDPEVMTQQGQ